ncbi:MAG: zinc ribbon domain-containing protein [Haloquadratum sp.]
MQRERGKRPWLAALLGMVATGLGHFYLRRWKRGLGWIGATLGASFLFVPPEAAQAFLAGEGDLAVLAPVIAVGLASVADAYVLARIRQRQRRVADEARSAAAGGHALDQSTGVGGMTDAAPTCPNCGKELDPELDFCPWCTTRLSDGA